MIFNFLTLASNLNQLGDQLKSLGGFDLSSLMTTFVLCGVLAIILSRVLIHKCKIYSENESVRNYETNPQQYPQQYQQNPGNYRNFPEPITSVSPDGIIWTDYLWTVS